MYKIMSAKEFFTAIKVETVVRLGERRLIINGRFHIKIGSKGLIRVEE